MPVPTDVLQTTLVLLFWFWPIVLGMVYVAVAGSRTLARLAHGAPAQLPPRAGRPASLGSS
jgi:hypothetical protein